MKAKLLLAICLFSGYVIGSDLPLGVKLLETVTVDKNAVGIPYTKYQLDNGLTVILHQDNSSPLVSVDVSFHVGSARELPGHSGFAHLFEHMMFQGSMHVKKTEHFKIITEAGGTLNGTTNTDRTHYYETVPSNQLEKVLWLESDRMGFFVPALTEEKYENQLATVKNERSQNVDNQPYGRVRELFSQAFYPKNHPYSWPTIGWMEDLNRTSYQDVKKFFLRWYNPNNATLVIGGDINPDEVIKMVAKYFGPIPKGPAVKNIEPALLSVPNQTYLSLEDNISNPMLRIGYPTVYPGHEDEAALDVLSSILGTGKNSFFYKDLVKTGYALQVGVADTCSELSCQFAIFILANPNKNDGNLKDIYAQMQKSFNNFEARGVLDSDLEKVKTMYEADSIFSLQSIENKVSMLAENQTLFKTPDTLASDLAKVSKVTKEDVIRVYNKYIKNKNSVIMSVVPKGKLNLIVASDNFNPEPIKVSDKAVDGDYTYRQIEGGLDRSVMPKSDTPIVVDVPKLWNDSLSNSIAVTGTVSNITPTTEFVVYFNGGHRLEPVDKSGLAALTAALLAEDSKSQTSSQISQKLESLGSDIYYKADASQSYIRVSSLTKNLDATMAVLEDQFLHPGFTQEDFDKVKNQTLQSLAHALNDPHSLGMKKYVNLLYGDKNSAGQSVKGTIDSVQKLTLDDVKAFYKKQYTKSLASIVVISNLSVSDLMPKLEILASIGGDEVLLPPLQKVPNVAHKIYIIDKKDAPQSLIIMGKRLPVYDAMGDHFKLTLANYILGGAFNSRINLNLREDKGYTYGARSSVSGGTEFGAFTIITSVRSDVTSAALKEIVTEVNQFVDKEISTKELNFMQSSIVQSQALDYETPYQKIAFIRHLQKYNLPTNYTQKQNEIIQNITKDEIDKLAKEYLNINKMAIVIVGDKSKILPQLQKDFPEIAIE